MKINSQIIYTLKKALLIYSDTFLELPKMESNIFDSILIDPPYGINNLGKEWDNFSPEVLAKKIANHINDDKLQSARSLSMYAGQYDLSLAEARGYEDWCFKWAIEALRVLKPGGHLLSFCSPRMYHRMTVALEEAGFEIRDTMNWVFGTGFPKSVNIASTIKKYNSEIEQVNANYETGLKPAMELICLARKPLSEKSITANFLKWGTGGLNIEGCRIYDGKKNRWAANVIFDEEAAQSLDAQSKSFPSRFFYCPKPDDKEKNAGLEDLPIVQRYLRSKSKKVVQPQQNPHPTIKPVKLLRYLAKLITPKNGCILDCFMGSGSCGIAATLEDFKYVGIEKEKLYFDVAKKRIQYYLNKNKAA